METSHPTSLRVTLRKSPRFGYSEISIGAIIESNDMPGIGRKVWKYHCALLMANILNDINSVS